MNIFESFVSSGFDFSKLNKKSIESDIESLLHKRNFLYGYVVNYTSELYKSDSWVRGSNTNYWINQKLSMVLADIELINLKITYLQGLVGEISSSKEYLRSNR